MDEYAGRILAGRYRLPRPPADEFEMVESRAFDTYSGQEVVIRQLPLPEVVSAYDDDGAPDDDGVTAAHRSEPARRALAAARAAAALPDHPRLVQVFDVLIEDGSLWVVSELVPGARPVAALLAERPFGPYRAAEMADDLMGGLRVLHAQGWAHRNITAATVLICADGRAMLDGLAAGAAQEALCGYNPVPEHVLAATGAGERRERELGEDASGWAGPDSALAMERARQARIAVIGPVTERWAPEQAGAVHENWQLAPPVGPPADLWALGALLFRCVQGRAPYPEDSAAELAQLVCARQPAAAEECGPLRPVVESLLRQDPTERPDFEALRGWLATIVRSAPEPGLGTRTVQVPADPPDPRRLPVKRRKGELVRQRRRGAKDTAPVPVHGRHARGREAGAPRGPRRLGLMLLVVILVLLLAAVAYAVLFMPRSQAGDRGTTVLPGPTTASAPPSPAASTAPSDQPTTQTSTTSALAPGFTVRTDPAGFSVAVHDGWRRSLNGGEIVYTSPDGAYQLIVVPGGRDSATAYGSDPISYETAREPELAAFRASDWASSAGLHLVDMDGSTAAEGEFAWLDSGRHRYARNLAILRNGSYHVVLVIGPDSQRDAVTAAFDAAAQSYRPKG